MTLDNIFAITIQLYIGFIAALFYSLIPVAGNFWLMVAAIVLMNIAMAVHRTPTIALMPDITPSKHLSKANGINDPRAFRPHL